MTPADQELTVPGARLRFRDEGAGGALVLIHGWTLDLDMWEPQVSELRESVRLVRYDRRGFGLSTGTPSLTHDVTDLLALCRHLKLDSVAVLGMSQGARVAALLTALRPGLVSRVIFDGAPFGTVAQDEPHPSDIPLAKFCHLARVGGIEAFREEWRKHPLTRLQTRDPHVRALVKLMIDRYRGADLLSAAEAATANVPPPTAPPPAAIRVPALVISGAFDLESRFSAAAALANVLPSSERVIVPKAGHMPNLDNPSAYNAWLRRFLAGSG